ncbi:MAG: hypothetical protein Q9210_004313 [Variospora velana]
MVLPRLKAGHTLLDIGACLGQDLRKCIFDGAPATNLYASDLFPEYEELAYDLWRDQDKLPSGHFFADDILADNASFTSGPLMTHLGPASVDITTITMFLHLFNYENQLKVATRILRLLSHRPGSMILGSQAGSIDFGEQALQPPFHRGEAGVKRTVFRHNPESFERLWREAGQATVETVIRFVVEEKGGSVPQASDLQDIHAILITGSTYDAHGDNPRILKLVDLIQSTFFPEIYHGPLFPNLANTAQLYGSNAPDIRFSGVCFGHQILCRALGAKVDATPDSKWELAHTPITLTPIGAKLFNNPKGGVIHLHQLHQDHVIYLPSSSTTSLLPEQNDRDIHVWGSSATTEVQGVYIRKRLFTTQGHLGFDEDMVRRQIELRIQSGSIDREYDKAELDEAWDTAEAEHDGIVVAGAIRRFFHGDDDDV